MRFRLFVPGEYIFNSETCLTLNYQGLYTLQTGKCNSEVSRIRWEAAVKHRWKGHCRINRIELPNSTSVLEEHTHILMYTRKWGGGVGRLIRVVRHRVWIV